MSDAERATTAPRQADGEGSLEPFTGAFVPGICFESGHCFWLLDFATTPTQFGSYTEFWIVTPDGERVLYTDPGEATEEVLAYHEFDRTVGADVRHERRPGGFEVAMEATDGTAIELRGSTDQSLGTRVLNAVIGLTPDPILRSGLGTTISTASMNALLDVNGLNVAGRTETERRYRLDADRLALIADASATLDGQDLGAVRPPSRPIEFGDAKTTGDALYVPGTLNLERVQ